jgi:hypothetical protein
MLALSLPAVNGPKQGPNGTAKRRRVKTASKAASPLCPVLSLHCVCSGLLTPDTLGGYPGLPKAHLPSYITLQN